MVNFLKSKLLPNTKLYKAYHLYDVDYKLRPAEDYTDALNIKKEYLKNVPTNKIEPRNINLDWNTRVWVKLCWDDEAYKKYFKMNFIQKKIWEILNV